jgi:hypothetical protein
MVRRRLTSLARCRVVAIGERHLFEAIAPSPETILPTAEPVFPLAVETDGVLL